MGERTDHDRAALKRTALDFAAGLLVDADGKTLPGTVEDLLKNARQIEAYLNEAFAEEKSDA